MDTINILSYYINVAWTYIWFCVTYLYDHFREFSFIIKVASISVTVSILLILWSLVRIGIKSWKRRRRKKVENNLEKKYGDGIRYILSSESGDRMNRDEVVQALGLEQKEDKNYSALLKNDKMRWAFCRLVYQERITEVSSAERRSNIKVLLELFNLPGFLEQNVNKGSMERKVEAMHMLQAFKLPVNSWLANQMIRSKRSRARKLAMYGSIMSNSNSDMSYFESEYFDENCCIYDEIQLGYILQRRRASNRPIPNLAHWAHIHKNPRTQCVFIRMMRFFNQEEYCSDLEPLFSHDSDAMVIDEISRTWGYMRYFNGEELMRDVLLTQPDETKVTIMHALSRIDSGDSLDTFIDIYTHSGSQKVRFEALRCMYNYGEAGMAKFEELEAVASETDKKIFDFFHNPLTREQIKLADSVEYEQAYGDNLYSVAL